MLTLYYGREHLDKDRFLFDQIAQAYSESGGGRNSGSRRRVFLLVPDQYTLQAERNAFFHLNIDGMMDLEVLSVSRLAFKVLSEAGGSDRTPVDKYGRHMLLSKIVSEQKESLTAFKGMDGTGTFIEMTNNLISEMKQHNTSPEELLEIVEGVSEIPLLSKKLADIHRIYSRYEEQIADKYIDTEDHMELFISKIKESTIVKEGEFFISGFDTFTPKVMRVIEQLLRCSRGVRLITAGQGQREDGKRNRDDDLFEVTEKVLYRFRKMALANGIVPVETEVPETYKITCSGNGSNDGGSEIEEHGKAPEIAHIEKELYAYPYVPYKGNDIGGVRLCSAANYYGEVETAAAEILRLIREEEMRFRDIAVICNDMETRGSIIKRIFSEYGIPAFMDKKRKLVHNPAVVFITSLLAVVDEGYRFEDVFQLVKTGFSSVVREDWEVLENYAHKYKIKGRRWKSEFRYGLTELGDEGLAYLNQLRRTLIDPLASFEKRLKKAGTAAETTRLLYEFIADEVEMPLRLETLAEQLNEQGEYEYADEMSQVFGVVVNLLDQLVELIGGEELTLLEFRNILISGFEAVEVGVIPSTMDAVIVGTMQRTRAGRIKALFVIGANDGVLPAGGASEGILSPDEKALLLRKEIEICKEETMQAMEEKLAIYKNLSRPEQYIWIGHSVSDMDGREIRPSLIFDKIRKLFPLVPVEKDILNRGRPLELAASRQGAVEHLAAALRGASEGEELDQVWQDAWDWFLEKERDLLGSLEDGLFFTNYQQRLDRRLVEELYGKGPDSQIVISPSRLERFSRCPFSHLLQYGLRPEERRVFEVSGREAGDIYHECLMQFSRSLTEDGADVTAEGSPWMTMTRDECRMRIHQVMDEAAAEYKEGVLLSGEGEQYRMARMKRVCADAAWALVEHVQKGRIKKLIFETEFGIGKEKALPPIRMETSGGEVRIEGKIDRVDVLPDGHVKIIDYKSGKERFDISEVRGGWRLQLMLYMKAALGTAGDKPAGVFYFEIAEPMVDATTMKKEELEEKIKAEMKRSFKLDGVMLDDPKIIEEIAGDFDDYSDIIPVRKKKDGTYSGTTDAKLLSEEEFTELQDTVDQLVGSLAEELVNGKTDIYPKKTRYNSACKYCQFKSICNFDPTFPGCSYDVVK